MSGPVNSVVATGTSDLERLKRAVPDSVEDEKLRLRKATQEFESFFLYQMLKAMRKTVPESSLGKDTPLSDGLGKDTFTEMFDMEIARSIKMGGNTSIAELLYNSLEKLIDARAGEDRTIELKPLHPAEQVPLPIEREPGQKELDSESTPIPLKNGQGTFPIQPKSVKITSDPIMGRYGRFIDEAAQATRLDSALIASVIEAESAGEHTAVSPAGAKGLMQLMDGTAEELGVVNVFDPRENINAGARYLRRMIDRFGDLDTALAAYNAGPGTVKKYDGMPPFDETHEYVKRVYRLLNQKQAKKIALQP